VGKAEEAEHPFTLKVTKGVGTSHTIDDLLPGTYILTEDENDLPEGVAPVENDVEIEITDEDPETVEVTFTNNRDMDLGSLKIVKNITLNGEPADTKVENVDYTFSFRVTGPGGYVETRKLTVKDGISGTEEITGLLPGAYTVTEITDGLAGYIALTAEPEGPVTVTSNETVEAAFTNDIVVGSLSIEKVATVNGKTTEGDWVDGTYHFTVTGPAFKTPHRESITVTAGVSDKVIKLDKLVAGSYTVTEDRTGLSKSIVVSGEGTKTLDGGYTPDEPLRFVITNDKTVPPHKLIVTKAVTVNGSETTEDWVDGEYHFTVRGPVGKAEEAEHPFTLKVTKGVGTSHTIDDLLPGKYIVTEDENGLPDGVKPVKNNIEIEIKDDSPDEVEFTFTNNKDVGELEITKRVTVNDEATNTNLVDGEYHFTVLGPNGYHESVTIEIENGEAKTETLTGLVPGEYTVIEDESKLPARVTLATSNNVQATVARGGKAQAQFTNNYETPLGGLIISKAVQYNGAATKTKVADGTYVFKVTGPDFDREIELTIEDGEGAGELLEELIPGVYTITELGRKVDGETVDLPAGMTVIGGKTRRVTVVSGGEEAIKTVEFTNNLELGELHITKRVTVNGSSTNSRTLDGEYKFKVTCPDGTVRTETVTVERGRSTTVILQNLPMGEYKVEEITDGLASGITYKSGNGVKTLEVTRAGRVPSISFTITNDMTVATPTPRPTNPPTGGGGGGGGTIIRTNPTPTPFVTPIVTNTPQPEDTPEVETSETPEVDETPIPDDTPTPEVTPTVTPSPSPTPETHVDVRKIWRDDSNAHRTRPSTITVQLLRDDVVIDTATFSGSADGWFYRFSHLPLVDEAGVPYRYSVLEVAVDGYETTVSGNTITNTLIDQPPTRVIGLMGRKIWEDDGAVSSRPAQITVVLLRDGSPYERRTVTANNGWQFSFQDLPYDDGFGHVYTYEFREEPTEGYYSRMRSDNEIVNYPLEYEYFDGLGTPLAGFDNETEEDLEELIELFGYDSPLWGEQLLPTGDDIPPYVLAFGGVGLTALIALIVITIMNKRKQQAA
jgi:hypothetical protein